MSNSTTNLSKETRLAPEPLTTCPKCTYALTGLPSAHRCPECGFEYDEHSWSWRMPKSNWNILRFLAGFMVIFIFWAFWLFLHIADYDRIFEFGLVNMILLILHVFIVVLFVVLGRWLIFNTRPPAIETSPHGVTIRGITTWKFVVTIPWTRNIDVKEGTGLQIGGYIISVKSKQMDLGLFLSNPKEWEVLKKALLDAKAHYQSLKKANKK